MRTSFLLATIAVFLFFQKTYADVLLIDMNDQPGIRTAVKEAAALRGEKVYIYPAEGSPHNAFLFGKDQVDAFVGRVIAQNPSVQFTSFVIDSHDGNEEFWGRYNINQDTAYLNSMHIAEIFKAHRENFRSLRSLYLWGCYTGARGALRGLLLSQLMPETYPLSGAPVPDGTPKLSYSDLGGQSEQFNIKLIAGYEYGAPANNRPDTLVQLKKVMTSEDRLVSYIDAGQLAELDRAVGQFGYGSFSILVGNRFYSRNKPATDINQLPSAAECHEIMESTTMQSYQLAIRAESSELGDYTDPEDDTANGQYRTLYNFIQGNASCAAVDPTYPDPIQARLLLFFNDIRHILIAKHSAELTELNNIGLKYSIPGISPAAVGDHKIMSRHVLLQRWKALKVSLDAIRPRANATEWTRAQFLWRGFNDIFTLESADRILHNERNMPRSWVEGVGAASQIFSADNFMQYRAETFEIKFK